MSNYETKHVYVDFSNILKIDGIEVRNLSENDINLENLLNQIWKKKNN